jgi:RND family efflux transporter MFP subunit
MLNMNKKTITFFLFFCLAVVGIVYYLSFYRPIVDIASPRIGKTIEAVYATGKVEPGILVPLSPRQSGVITEILADEGQQIRRGDKLLRLEDTDLRAKIDEIQARLQFAQQDLSRKKNLYASRSISREQVEAADKELATLNAQKLEAETRKSYYALIAPADGQIVKRDGEIGQTISAGQTIFYFSCCAPNRITAEVDEEDIPKVQTGQKVLIQNDAFPDEVFDGTISSITPMGDTTSRSYRVRIAYNNQNVPLMIGMTVETNIILKSTDNALLIPAMAVSKDKKIQKIIGNQIIVETVLTGSTDGQDISVLSGLTAQDKVVVPFQDNFKGGEKVRIK